MRTFSFWLTVPLGIGLRTPFGLALAAVLFPVTRK
jgi:hypothetical protein